MWPWPSLKRVKTPWPTFRFSDSSKPTTWPRMFLFGRMGMWGSRHSLLFGRPRLTFATVTRSYMTDINYSYLKVVTTTLKPLDKQTRTLWDVVDLLASLSTNMTLSLWMSVKVAWPNFRLGRFMCLTESLHTQSSTWPWPTFVPVTHI